MTTPADPRHGGQPWDKQQQPGFGQPGYGTPPGYGQPPGGHGAGYPGSGHPGSHGPGSHGPGTHTPQPYQQPSGPPPGYGQQQPGYPPPGGYGPPGPAGYPNGQPGHQQPSGYPAPSGSGRPVPPGAPGPIPEWWERFLGRFLDNLIFVVISSILSSVVGGMYTPSTAEIIANGFRLPYGYYVAIAVVYLICGALFGVYDVVMHSRNGQTLGKMALKTRVVTPSGGQPDQAALLRRAAIYPAGGFLLGAVSMLVPGFGLGLLIGVVYAVAMSVPIFTDPLRRGLHDKWSDTIVVKAG